MPKRDITLPPVHNKRAPAQWDIIGKHVDFEDKTVLDLGCGYGDIVHRCHAAGARYVHGVDKDKSLMYPFSCERQVINYLDYSYTDLNKGLKWLRYDIENNLQWDVAICFSVLPYLDGPASLLKWMYFYSSQALIECQYSGDGPGFSWLKDDYDMRRWLEQAGFETIEPIGKTLVKDRDKYRTIWLCQ